jgi:hypothetical protein
MMARLLAAALLALAVSGCMLTAQPVLCDEPDHVPMPKPRPADLPSVDLCELVGCHGAIIMGSSPQSRRGQ